jgi:hypothetical protein
LGHRVDRSHLERHPEEWQELDALTNITISRFYCDRGVFAFIQSEVLPALVSPSPISGSRPVEGRGIRSFIRVDFGNFTDSLTPTGA